MYGPNVIFGAFDRRRYPRGLMIQVLGRLLRWLVMVRSR